MPLYGLKMANVDVGGALSTFIAGISIALGCKVFINEINARSVTGNAQEFLELLGSGCTDADSLRKYVILIVTENHPLTNGPSVLFSADLYSSKFKINDKKQYFVIGNKDNYDMRFDNPQLGYFVPAPDKASFFKKKDDALDDGSDYANAVILLRLNNRNSKEENAVLKELKIKIYDAVARRTITKDKPILLDQARIDFIRNNIQDMVIYSRKEDVSPSTVLKNFLPVLIQQRTSEYELRPGAEFDSSNRDRSLNRCPRSGQAVENFQFKSYKLSTPSPGAQNLCEEAFQYFLADRDLSDVFEVETGEPGTSSNNDLGNNNPRKRKHPESIIQADVEDVEASSRRETTKLEEIATSFYSKVTEEFSQMKQDYKTALLEILKVNQGTCSISDDPNQIFFRVHCHSHRLQLSIKNVMKQLTALSNAHYRFECTVNGLYSFYNSHAVKRAASLKAYATQFKHPLTQIKSIIKIRWISSQFPAIRTLKSHYFLYLFHLKSLTTNADFSNDYVTKATATGYYLELKSLDFALYLHFIMDVLRPINDLCQSLQRKLYSITQLHEDVENTISRLNDLMTHPGSNLESFVSLLKCVKEGEEIQCNQQAFDDREVQVSLPMFHYFEAAMPEETITFTRKAQRINLEIYRDSVVPTLIAELRNKFPENPLLLKQLSTLEPVNLPMGTRGVQAYADTLQPLVERFGGVDQQIIFQCVQVLNYHLQNNRESYFNNQGMTMPEFWKRAIFIYLFIYLITSLGSARSTNITVK